MVLRMGRISIQEFPPEILGMVLTRLHPRDIISAQLVSRLWNDLVKNSADIKYIIELWRDGLLRGDDGTLTSAECLVRLYARREAWRNLKWSSKSSVQMESLETCRAYALVGGVFALRASSEDCLDVLPLASLPDGADSQESTSKSALSIPTHQFQDMELDPGQDLLVLLHTLSTSQGALDFRKLSVPNAPHPSALLETIQFEWNPGTEGGTEPLTIQILDDIVTVYLEDIPQLLVIDWRRGIVVLSLVFNEDRDFVVDCHFLSPRTFVLACTRSSDARHGYIQLYTLPEKLAALSVQTHIASLDFPLLAGPVSDCGIAWIDVMAGPFITRPTPGKPFYQSNDRRIVSFSIQYKPEAWVCLVVHVQTLQSLVEQHQKHPPDGGAVTKTWEEWGPTQTRMIKDVRQLWTRHVHGEWIALPLRPACCMRLLDFNVSPLAVSKASEGQSTDIDSSDDENAILDFDVLRNVPSRLQIMCSTESASASDNNSSEFPLFTEPVCTSLPYREVQRMIGSSESAEYPTFLLDEDHILTNDTSNSNSPMSLVVFKMS
ncbi:hypothetical protein C8F01DRAFT_1067347 [Mycena amicta]|nr:hypothetical protein C8F01DRAFT_1067347 [Mycena amicta]